MSRQCNEAIATYNASPDTDGDGIANRPIKAKIDLWQRMRTNNEKITSMAIFQELRLVQR